MEYEYQYFWKPTDKEKAKTTYNNMVKWLKDSTQSMKEFNDKFKRNMKTTILSLLLTLSVYSQTDFIKIQSLTDTVNVGDTLYIHFTKSVNVQSNGMSRIQLWTSSYLQDCMYMSSMMLNQLPKDSNNYFIQKVRITQSMGTGNARIYSNNNPSPGYKPFYIKSVSVVGINELSNIAEITNVQYFDIYGKEKTTYTDGLLIKITTYSNGYQKKEKIIQMLSQ